jgi:S1-C subfamily serine protease
MRKMLGILGSLVLCGSAFAADMPDRATLSYDENVIINTACASSAADGASSFRSCVSRQLTQLRDHPTPDRSGLTGRQLRKIESFCGYLRREGIGLYNDCYRKAMTSLSTADAGDSVDDDLMPKVSQIFADDGDHSWKAIPALPTSLPQPASALPTVPDHVAERPLAAEDLYRKVMPSVYIVWATRSLADGRVVQGSAVAVSEHLLLTACHVVKDRPLIKLEQDRVRYPATLVAADNDTDRCVISTDAISLVPVAGVRSWDTLVVGERVFAVGAPLYRERTLSDGLISGLRPHTSCFLSVADGATHAGICHMVQTSAAIGHGSSGGGLFDERGNLIGITTLASFGGAQNLNYAVAAADYWH